MVEHIAPSSRERHAQTDPDFEWGIKALGKEIFPCRNEDHARGMMRSTSVVLGPMEGRKVVKRPRVHWEEVD